MLQTVLWNLCARSVNITQVLLRHIKVSGDSLVIYFAQTKVDQVGEQSAYGRHVYANPVRPALCPVLSLGIYFATSSFATAYGRDVSGEEAESKTSEEVVEDAKMNRQLFPGNSQTSRFTKSMRSFLDHDVALKNMVEQNGITIDDLASHSFRKGSLTYLTSGSTASPSIIAVQIRAG